MLDSMNPFLFSGSSKARANPFAFHMVDKEGRLFDSVSGIQAVCVANGTRYGVVNGVVTAFPANTPRVEDKGLPGCPAFSQSAKYSENLSDALWGKARSLVSLLPETHEGMSVWRFTETNLSGVHQLFQSASFGAISDNSVIGSSHRVKSNGRNVRVYARLKDNSVIVICDIHLGTGVVSNVRSGSAVAAIDKGDGWFQIFATVNVGAGATNPYIYISLLSGTTDSYLGDGNSGIYVSQPTYVNFGINGTPFIPPYVPNNTSGSVSVVSEVGGASNGMSFPIKTNPRLAQIKKGLQGPLAQGHFEIEVESNVDSGWLSINSHTNILSANNANLSVLYVTKDGLGNLFFRCYDGTNLAVVSIPPITVGQTFRISLDYGTYTDGTQKMRLTVNGVKSNVVPFSGSFGFKDLVFFLGGTIHGFWIKLGSLKFIPKPIWVY